MKETLKVLLLILAAGLGGALVGDVVSPSHDPANDLSLANVARLIEDQRRLLDDMDRRLQRVLAQGPYGADELPQPLAGDVGGSAPGPGASMPVEGMEDGPGSVGERLVRIENLLRGLPDRMSAKVDEIPADWAVEKQADAIGQDLDRLSTDFAALNRQLFGLSPKSVYARYGQPTFTRVNDPSGAFSLRWVYRLGAEDGFPAGRTLYVDFSGGLVSLVSSE